MKIHEYQAKSLLSRYGVPVLKSSVVFNAADAGRICYEDFESKGSELVVLKVIWLDTHGSSS
jgi:succinyl-CoA synthetase beta subunit